MSSKEVPLSTWQEDFHTETGTWAEVNDGWKELVTSTHSLLRHIDPEYKVDQVKEKFGTLRYYFSPSLPWGSPEAEIMSRVVSYAEQRSAYTCEDCSDAFDAKACRVNGWVRTLCPECYTLRVQEYKEYEKKAENA